MPDPTPVQIVDVKIPFGSLVMLFVKAALAAIPAAIILAVIGTVIGAIFSGFVRARYGG